MLSIAWSCAGNGHWLGVGVGVGMGGKLNGKCNMQ